MADDFLQKKKENGAILDLSKSACETKEDLRKLLDKVPDFKIRPVKYRTEDIKIRDKKEYKFKTSKKDFKVLKETYNFPEPIPVEMKTVKLEDLVTIPIDWRMLTMLRPKLKLDEDYYSRLVELGKSQLKTRQQDRRMGPETFIRKTKNKSGVIETRVIACRECGEEFCDGKTCGLCSYDSFGHVGEELKPTGEASQADKPKKGKKTKRRSRSKTKNKGRQSKSKSKSPAKSATRKQNKTK